MEKCIKPFLLFSLLIVTFFTKYSCATEYTFKVQKGQKALHFFYSIGHYFIGKQNKYIHETLEFNNAKVNAKGKVKLQSKWIDLPTGPLFPCNVKFRRSGKQKRLIIKKLIKNKKGLLHYLKTAPPECTAQYKQIHKELEDKGQRRPAQEKIEKPWKKDKKEADKKKIKSQQSRLILASQVRHTEFLITDKETNLNIELISKPIYGINFTRIGKWGKHIGPIMTVTAEKFDVFENEDSDTELTGEGQTSLINAQMGIKLFFTKNSGFVLLGGYGHKLFAEVNGTIIQIVREPTIDAVIGFDATIGDVGFWNLNWNIYGTYQGSADVGSYNTDGTFGLMTGFTSEVFVSTNLGLHFKGIYKSQTVDSSRYEQGQTDIIGYGGLMYAF